MERSFRKRFAMCSPSISLWGCEMSKSHSRSQRGLLRGWLRRGLHCSALSLASVGWISVSHGQLKTGREVDREFYSDVSQAPTRTVASQASKPKAVGAASKSQVTKASHQNLPTSASAPSKRVSSDVRTPPSKVVQAGCKNCQAGVPHTHNSVPFAVNEGSINGQESVVIQDESNVEFETGVAAPMSDGSSCGGTTCCPDAGYVQPFGILSSVLCRVQLRIEAATFWPEGQNLPQLVTTRRPANDPATDGLIGRTDTVNLFGGNEVLGESVQGIRGELGTYFDACQNHGILLRFFDAGSNSESYSSTPTSEPVVMRPFFSTANNAQSTFAVNYPGSTSGSLDARISSELYGGDILFRKMLSRDCGGHLEFLAGYQTARLADDLSIASTTTALTNTPAPAGTVSQITDRFETTNRFNGLTLGLSGIMRDRVWSLSGMFKLGLGNMERSVLIDGASTFTVPGNPPSTNTTTNGLLARSTNSGSYVSETFVVSPEVNVTLGYRLTRNLEATVGYGFLALPKVARVADQLDPQLAVNLNDPLSGALRPAFVLTERDFALHSLNYGLQWRF
jgi:hypothetical protein